MNETPLSFRDSDDSEFEGSGCIYGPPPPDYDETSPVEEEEIYGPPSPPKNTKEGLLSKLKKLFGR